MHSDKNASPAWRRAGNALWPALLLALFAGPSAADEDIYFSSLPIVATASRLPQALAEAPAAVTVIDRDMIRASGARQVYELLRLVPGFSISSPGQGDSPAVAYHGLANNDGYPAKVQVLVDGRSQYSPLFGSGVNWRLLPVALEDIERIEVIRGANAAAFGSNAFMGVINIITLHPSQAPGWMLATNQGSQGVRDETLRWGGRMGATDVRFTYRQQADNGLSRERQCPDDVCTPWHDPRDGRQNRLMDLHASLPLTDRDELELSISGTSEETQIGLLGSSTNPYRDQRQGSTAFNLGWHRALSANEEVRLRFSRVEDRAKDAFRAQDKFGAIPVIADLDNGGKSISHELEFQHISAPWQEVRVVWGGAFQGIEVQSPKLFYPSEPKRREIYRTFGNLEWRPGASWLFNLGAGLEHDSITGTTFDPRLSASYHLTPEHTLRAIASRAHRTPSLYEARGILVYDIRAVGLPLRALDYRFVASPGLQPERLDTLEAGYLADIKAWRASLDLRIFHERIPNRIQVFSQSQPLDSALLNTKSSDTAYNAEGINIYGFEYQAKWQPFDGTRLMYNEAYTDIHARMYDNLPTNDPSNVPNFSRKTELSAPKRSHSAMAVQELPGGLEASVMYFWQRPMSWTRRTQIHGYSRVDWRLAYPFKMGGKRGELAYTAQASNGPHDAISEFLQVTERHWLSLRLEM